MRFIRTQNVTSAVHTRAQVAIEFILLAAVIIVVLLALFRPDGVFQDRVNKMIYSGDEKVSEYNSEIVFP